MRAYTHACVSSRAAANVRAGPFLQSILPSPQPAADERAVLDARRGRVRGAPVGKGHEARCEAQMFWNRRAEERTKRGALTCLPLLLFSLLFFVMSCDVVAESSACREIGTLVFFIYACLHRPPAHHSLASTRWAACLYPRSLVTAWCIATLVSHWVRVCSSSTGTACCRHRVSLWRASSRTATSATPR
jgi:hypothetical protein